MPDPFEQAAKLAATLTAKRKFGNDASTAAIDAATRDLSALIRDNFGSPRLPGPKDTVAVALTRSKTAALFFDKVWTTPFLRDGPPGEISVYGATLEECLPQIVTIISNAADETPEAVIDSLFKDGILANWPKKPATEKNVNRVISEILLSRHAVRAQPLYSSPEQMNSEYRIGDTPALVAAIENIAVVDEAALTWPQVVEFRKDGASTASLRRMRHWIDASFEGKPASFVQDAMAIQLETYEEALAKHGVKTAQGVIAELLDDKFITGMSAAAAAAGMASGGIAAAMAAGGLVVGRASLSIWKRTTDIGPRSDLQGSEVAFAHEIKKLAK